MPATQPGMGISNELEGISISFLFLNARKLVRAESKASELYLLLESKMFPSIVAVTELGCGPGENVFEFFAGTKMSSKYSIVWKTRTCSVMGAAITDPKQVGGGILFLVKKCLEVDIEEFAFSFPEKHRRWLHGHFCVWRLKPKPNHRKPNPLRIQKQIVISIVYAPPNSTLSAWGQSRKHIFEAMVEAQLALKRAASTRGAFYLSFGHLNAQDGGCDVPIHLDLRPQQLRQITDQIKNTRPIRHRASLSCPDESTIVLRRLKSRSTKRSTKEGRELIARMAAVGMVPVNGVMSGRQPDTWQSCNKCDSKSLPLCLCRGRRGRLVNVNDVVFVPALCVVDSLLHAGQDKSSHRLQFAAHRIRWTGALDHAVCSGKVFVPYSSPDPILHTPPPLAPPSQEMDDNLQTDSQHAGCSMVKKPRAPPRLPLNLLSRFRVLKQVRLNFDELSHSTIWPPVSDINRLSRELVHLVQTAYRAARSSVPDEVDTLQDELVRLKRAELEARWHLHSVICSKKRSKGLLRKAAGRTVRAASQRVRRATSQLHHVRELANYQTLAKSHSRAPKESWKRMERELDPLGSIHDDKACKLLLQLHDTSGKVISSDKLNIVQHLITHRKGVFQVRSNLHKSCEDNIDFALTQLTHVNKDIRSSNTQLSESSACHKAADDVSYLISNIDKRRNYDRSTLDAAPLQPKIQEQLNKIATRRADFVHQIQKLESEISMDELKQAVHTSQEVGTGVDGMQIAVMRHFEPDQLQKHLELLNQVWNSGVFPDSWKIVRCLLHYKGKGSDVYCVANYRGLGISDGLCKILSLIMTRRLETFLETTGSLSHNQGGFRPKRGTPEQTFTLTETVRSRIQTENVQLCFIDIERAYDSVLHPILWKRCSDLGIGGRFLSTLQAMYDGAVAQLEIDQHVITPNVPIECGVLQGNPLSPLLFNIYFDSVIHALETAGQARLESGQTPLFGIPLPHFQVRRDAHPTVIPIRVAAEQTQADRLASIWFADDGSLPAADTPVLQLQVDVVDGALLASGLYTNVPKTKWMFIPTTETTEADYKAACAELIKAPLRVSGVAVDLVDEFDYLGTRLWWRWDWTRAWKRAQGQAMKQLGAIKMARFTYKDWSPFSSLVFANGKIFCHFNTIAAIAGAGGALSSAPWAANEDIVTETMNTLMRVRYVNQLALRCEFGIWDARTRIDMLLLRFWAKLLTCPQDSTHFRALCLSISNLSAQALAAPSKRYSAKGNTHRQPWAQQALAAAERLNVSRDSILKFCNTLVEIHAFVAGEWKLIRSTPEKVFLLLLLLLFPLTVQRVRLAVATEGHAAVTYEESVNCWCLPSRDQWLDPLSTWSEQLRLATFASLRARANTRRQQEVHRLMQAEAARQHSELRRYVRIKAGSFLEPYLFLRMSLARRVLQARADAAPNEGAARRRPLNTRAGTRQVQTQLPRLEEHQRACYLCPCIDGVDGVYWPETIEHTLLTCSFHQVRRAALTQSLELFAMEPTTMTLTIDVVTPDFNDVSCLFAIVFLCTIIPDQPILYQHQPQLPPPPTSDSVQPPEPRMCTRSSSAAHQQQMRTRAEARRCGPQIELSAAAARRAAAWVSCLLNDWSVKHRDCRSADPNTSPGRRFAELIATYHHHIFKARREALQSNTTFTNRQRDPIHADVQRHH